MWTPVPVQRAPQQICAMDSWWAPGFSLLPDLRIIREAQEQCVEIRMRFISDLILRFTLICNIMALMYIKDVQT